MFKWERELERGQKERKEVNRKNDLRSRERKKWKAYEIRKGRGFEGKGGEANGTKRIRLYHYRYKLPLMDVSPSDCVR